MIERRQRPRRSILLAAFIALASASPALAQSLAITADHSTGVYHSGDTAHWSLQWKAATPAPTAVHYVLKSGGLRVVREGDLHFTDNKATFDAQLPDPNTMLLQVTWEPQTPANKADAGVVADPDQIHPTAACPDDFDAFWKSKLDELSHVPPNARLEDADAANPAVLYSKITMDNIRGSHIQGQVARPRNGEKFPAIFIPQWAGVYALQKSWVTGYAAQGWLALNIEAHDIPIDKPEQYYKDLYNGDLKNYWMIGNQDRDTSYYLRMYLSCVQSIAYLKSRPDWNGKTIVVTGGSQGGQQTIAVAALCPQDVTAAIALVPAACDMWAPSIGRASGFPVWWDQTWGGRDANKVRESSKYYDPSNFAPRIKCPVLVGVGLHDDLAPPSSVFAMVNQITAPKELIILPTSGHQNEHGSQEPFNHEAHNAWLPALARGEPAPIHTP
jgi:cephalosporin-C deacetylase-like acetyl esterase